MKVTQEAFEAFLKEREGQLESFTMTACDPPMIKYQDQDGNTVASIHFEYDSKHPTGHPDKKPDWKEYYIQPKETNG